MTEGLPETTARLQGKTAVVTGATQGLGADIARVLIAAGARVCLVGRSREAGQSLAQSLGAMATFSETDITSDAAIDQCLQRSRAPERTEIYRRAQADSCAEMLEQYEHKFGADAAS